MSFKTPEQLATFSQAYDGHLFKDKQGLLGSFVLDWVGRRLTRWIGNEYQAVVEFAPYQKVPSAPKNDNRKGTIEDGSCLLAL
jgi:regulator of nonsense transcripts 3